MITVTESQKFNSHRPKAGVCDEKSNAKIVKKEAITVCSAKIVGGRTNLIALTT